MLTWRMPRLEAGPRAIIGSWRQRAVEAGALRASRALQGPLQGPGNPHPHQRGPRAQARVGQRRGVTTAARHPRITPWRQMQLVCLKSGAEDERWEAGTATDSDDDGDFNEAYGAALAEQLAGTRVGATFMQAADSNPAASSSAGGAAAAPGTQRRVSQQPPGDGGDLQPVDIDVNLVQSLLASYAGQQGLPGPAGALAGLMGIQLPDNADT